MCIENLLHFDLLQAENFIIFFLLNRGFCILGASD